MNFASLLLVCVFTKSPSFPFQHRAIYILQLLTKKDHHNETPIIVLFQVILVYLLFICNVCIKSYNKCFFFFSSEISSKSRMSTKYISANERDNLIIILSRSVLCLYLHLVTTNYLFFNVFYAFYKCFSLCV